MLDKPYSQACENNKRPILEALDGAFSRSKNVLEIGAGTGQHAVYFAPRLPHLQWYTADQKQYHDGINAWIEDNPSPNLHPPIALTLPEDNWPRPASKSPNHCLEFDAYYTANTAHIMSKEQVKYMMQTLNQRLPTEGVVCQYGPFTIEFTFSSQSNADFHQQLIARGCGGYRDISELQTWAPDLHLSDIIDMPANNLLLIWHKK